MGIIMGNVRKKTQIINIPDFCSRNEPMHLHTSFQIGGPADFFCTPRTINELIESINLARMNSLPFYVIGEGANILVADRGIRGVVISLANFSDYTFSADNLCTASAGVSVSRLSEAAGDRGLSGIEFLYSLPGSLGGAVYMNARCYGTSMADILSSVTYLSRDLEPVTLSREECDFGYKRSVFHSNKGIILRAVIRLGPGSKRDIAAAMEEYRRDRINKGHFAYPSAGSTFKNNRDFGEPTGKIIDSLGLRGLTFGGAMVSPIHGNIIMNTGNASASDVKKLVNRVKEEVYRAYRFSLEEEIRYLGEWE